MVRAMARTSMPPSIETLEAHVAQLQSTVDQQQAMIEERDALIAFYREWKRLFDSQRFGAKSERFAGDKQGRLFNEAEALAETGEEARPEEVSVIAYTRQQRGRRALPDFLPVREVLHDLRDEEKVCPHDASHRLVEIGREQSDQLQFIPATIE